MLCLRLAGVACAAVFLAGCMQTLQGPTAVATGPQSANHVMYGAGDPVRTSVASVSRPREEKATAAATPQVRAAEASARRKQMSDAPDATAQSEDIVYSEKWYQREQETENRLSQATKICRGC